MIRFHRMSILQTTTVNLAAELGGRGYRVLVADLDPQGHAGLGLGVRSAAAGASHLAFREDRADLTGGAPGRAPACSSW